MDYLEICELCHHGIKGQKWGVRRFQNEDGTLTLEGKAHYGVSDEDLKIGKKYRASLDKHKYRIPNTNNKKDLIAILKYDRTRENDSYRYFNSTKGILAIDHFKDKNGKIALTYARVPGFGDVYVAGPGTFTDEDLKKWFKKSPNKNEIVHSEFVITEEENMNYQEIQAICHSDYAEWEKERRKAELNPVNDDFYKDLPCQVINIMDNIRWQYRNEPWFKEAWEKYRKHVLDAGLGGKIKMPGFVFDEYIDKYVDNQEKKRAKAEKAMAQSEDFSKEDTIKFGSMLVDEYISSIESK